MIFDRPERLSIGEKWLPLPVYFPSVSSVKTALPPQDYVELLAALRGLNRQFLVSAFDLAALKSSRIVREVLATFHQEGGVVLMDSGNYESFWKDAQESWRQIDFHETLNAFPCDLAFSFDEQAPPADLRKHVDLILERWRADQAKAGDRLIVPIVHASAAELPVLCATVATEANIEMLAVAERKLGDGVLDRARTVQAIREALNGLGRYICLHVLGTGNPISLAIYIAMGADSFDGLEWCQTVVDHDTTLLYHLSQADFFAEQTEWGTNSELSFHARTLAHNIEFFAGWMERMRLAVKDRRFEEFCRHNLPSRAFQHCANLTGWVIP